MNTAELVSYASRLDVRLWLDGERLRFSAPAGVLTPELRAQLTERKQEILQTFLRTAQKAKLDSDAAILPFSRNGKLPLSFSQQRMWFIQQLGAGECCVSHTCRNSFLGPAQLRGTNAGTSPKSFRCHEVLRTTFTVVDAQPVQVVGPDFDTVLPLIDLRGLECAAQERYTEMLSAHHTAAQFDLSSGPLLRASLLRLSDDEHVFLVVMHHIISDGWSLGRLVQEIAALYDAFSGGRTSPLPELEIQYADFASWQREWLSGERLREQVSYWKQQLADAAILALPTDKPRPSVQTFAGAMSERLLPESLVSSLQALSRQSGTTLFMTMLAAFHVLLHSYAQQETILTGTPVSNRTRAEIEPLIGFFVNTLVLRSDFADDPSFLTQLARLRQHAIGAYAHQDLPFELLVDELQLPARSQLQPACFRSCSCWAERAGWKRCALTWTRA